MAARTAIRVLTYIHDEDRDFDAFKKCCKKHGGQYINFSMGRMKRFGFLFQRDDQLDEAFREWNERDLCTTETVGKPKTGT